MSSARPYVLAGYSVIALAIGATGLWASFAEVSSAVTAPGVVAPEGSRKTIAHLEGGTVEEVLVRDGDHVTSGQALVRLSPVQTGASLDALTERLQSLRAMEARMDAEARDVPLAYPADLTATKTAMDQLAIHQAAEAFVVQQIEVLESRIGSLEGKVRGWTDRRQAMEQTLASFRSQLVGAEKLERLNLKATNDVNELRRRILAVQADIGEATAEIESAKAGIAEARLQKVIVRHQARQDAATKLAEVRDQIAEASQKIAVAEDAAERTIIRAPEDGIVQAVMVHAKGAIVQPGQPVMELVPVSDDLVVEASVPSVDSDRVFSGMATEIKFPSLNARTTPRIPGTIIAVSGDAVPDSEGKRIAHKVTVKVDRGALSDDIRDRLMPGMPATVIAATGSRTVMSYLVRPLVDSLDGVMRER